MKGRLVFNIPMNELTPPNVILEAHQILKRLHEGRCNAVQGATHAALRWLENCKMVEVNTQRGNTEYRITSWGRMALLGREAISVTERQQVWAQKAPYTLLW